MASGPGADAVAAPPPEVPGALDGVTSGDGVPSFGDLIEQLRAQRAQELGRLQAEIVWLRQELDERAARPRSCSKVVAGNEARESARSEARKATSESRFECRPATASATSQAVSSKVVALESLMRPDSSIAPPLEVEVCPYASERKVAWPPEHARAISEASQDSMTKVCRATDLMSRGRWFVEGPLELAAGVLIFLNIACVFLFLELEGRSAKEGAGPDERRRLNHAALVVSNMFTFFFVVEFALRLFFLRSEIFVVSGAWQKANMFDAAVVCMGIVDSCVLSPLEKASAISVMRALRIVRVLRVVRTFDVFISLRLLLTGVFACFRALVWSMCVLGLSMLVSSLVLCQVLQSTQGDWNADQAMADWVYRYYGTSSRSMWTFFEVTFSGGWPNYVRPLIEQVHPAYSVFFALYISFVVFAMMRIITALFLKDTLAMASHDLELSVHERIKQKKECADSLRGFFHVADASQDGRLTWQEFRSILQSPQIKAFLGTLELDIQEGKRLFDLLDDGTGCVYVEDFVQGAMRLKGQARSLDVITIMRDCGSMLRKMDQLCQALNALHADEPRWLELPVGRSQLPAGRSMTFFSTKR